MEKALPGFAYELMSLEIAVDDYVHEAKNQKANPNSGQIITKITRLIQLYMLAVEALESREDNRYHFFNRKIRALMEKKHVVEQVHFASTGREPTTHLLRPSANDRVNLKESHDVRVMMSSEQFQADKVKEMLRQDDKRFTNIKQRIGQGIDQQN